MRSSSEEFTKPIRHLLSKTSSGGEGPGKAPRASSPVGHVEREVLKKPDEDADESALEG